jgi:predicted nucleic acid-binding protein
VISAIADTDALSNFIRRREPYRAVESLLAKAELATTTVNAFELWSWRASRAAEEVIHALLSGLAIFDLDLASARYSALVHRTLAERGTPVGDPDCLIAGVCLARELPLLTMNRTHFERVQGLELVAPD